MSPHELFIAKEPEDKQHWINYALILPSRVYRHGTKMRIDYESFLDDYA